MGNGLPEIGLEEEGATVVALRNHAFHLVADSFQFVRGRLERERQLWELCHEMRLFVSTAIARTLEERSHPGRR
jgi:hypothetical protein